MTWDDLSRAAAGGAMDTCVSFRRLQPFLRGRIRLARLPLLLVLAITAYPAIALAQSVDRNLWVTNGEVHSVAVDGNTLYIGGSFTQVGFHTGHGVPVDLGTGTARPGFPKVSGTVLAVEPDDSGGWFIGGAFDSVGGLARPSLAHIRSDLSVSPWKPDCKGSVRINDLTRFGSLLYAAGYFDTLDGQAHRNLVALDVATARATSWSPDPSSGVQNVAIMDSVVYITGSFGSVGGQSRPGVAAINARTGLPTSWNPNPDGRAYALEVTPSVVYVSGDFANIGGQQRHQLAAINRTTGLATGFSIPQFSGSILCLAANGPDLFVGGYFSEMGGQPRENIALLDGSGAATHWNPGTNLTVQAMTLRGPTLYLGGFFTTVGNLARNYAAAVNTTTGEITDWDPNAGNGVFALGVGASSAYVGGSFVTLGGATRWNIAALDANTGAATDWRPDADHEVWDIAPREGTIYVGGGFTRIGGAVRAGIAALDAHSGAAMPWNPTASMPGYKPIIFSVEPAGSRVYVAGSFLNIGGQPRRGVGALDAVTGNATPWDPHPDKAVSAILPNGPIVYLGGTFSEVGGAPRTYLAAVDSTIGVATDWSPRVWYQLPVPSHWYDTGNVTAFERYGSKLFVCGAFDSIDGAQRRGLAAFDIESGTLDPWDQNLDLGVYDMAIADGFVYAAGALNDRGWLGAFDVSSGALTGWHPQLEGSDYVSSLAAGAGTVYLGGRVGVIDGVYRGGIVALGDVVTPTLVALISAESDPTAVRLSWFSDDRMFASAVYRRTVKDDWTRVGFATPHGGGRITFVDTDIVAGTRYAYRVGIQRDGAERFSDETWVDVPRALAFGLEGLRPNPGSADARVVFTLPDGAPARLEVIDLAGRRVQVRDVGALGAGRHAVEWVASRTMAPGMYFIRLSRRGEMLTARALWVR